MLKGKTAMYVHIDANLFPINLEEEPTKTAKNIYITC